MDYYEGLLTEVRKNLPCRAKNWAGGTTALEGELPQWIAALEKEILLARRTLGELRREAGRDA